MNACTAVVAGGVTGLCVRCLWQMASKPPKKQKRTPSARVLTKAERVCEHLREIQWQTNCSTRTLQTILNSLRGDFGKLIREVDSLPTSVSQADKKMRDMVILKFVIFVSFAILVTIVFVVKQAGENYVFLHGCIGEGCNQVWEESDDGQVCPKCNAARFDDNGKPKESIIWFPLKPRLESLLSTTEFEESVRWEGQRCQDNDEYVTGLQLIIIYIYILHVTILFGL